MAEFGKVDPFGVVLRPRDPAGRSAAGGGQPWGAWRGEAENWQPPVDVIDEADEIRIVIDLPGVPRDSIQVDVAGDSLWVHGERAAGPTEDASYLHRERPVGQFTRSFAVGFAFDPERVHADYRDGVLSITVPKATTLRPRRVQLAARLPGDPIVPAPEPKPPSGPGAPPAHRGRRKSGPEGGR